VQFSKASIDDHRARGVSGKTQLLISSATADSMRFGPRAAIGRSITGQWLGVDFNFAGTTLSVEDRLQTGGQRYSGKALNNRRQPNGLRVSAPKKCWRNPVGSRFPPLSSPGKRGMHLQCYVPREFGGGFPKNAIGRSGGRLNTFTSFSLYKNFVPATELCKTGDLSGTFRFLAGLYRFRLLLAEVPRPSTRLRCSDSPISTAGQPGFEYSLCFPLQTGEINGAAPEFAGQGPPNGMGHPRFLGGMANPREQLHWTMGDIRYKRAAVVIYRRGQTGQPKAKTTAS